MNAKGTMSEAMLRVFVMSKRDIVRLIAFFFALLVVYVIASFAIVSVLGIKVPLRTLIVILISCSMMPLSGAYFARKMMRETLVCPEWIQDGAGSRVPWTDVVRARFLIGRRAFLITSRTGTNVQVSRSVADHADFRALVQTYAPPDSPLHAALATTRP